MPKERPRAQLWRPVWDGVFKKYAFSVIHANLWRVDTTMCDLEDLEQDCRIVFERLIERYPLVRNTKHFMALFKTALRNEFTAKANYKTGQDSFRAHTTKDVSEFFTNVGGGVDNYGYVKALLDEAPEEVKMVLSIVADGIKPRPRLQRKRMKHRLNLNGELRIILKKQGFMVSDPLGDVYKYLTQAAERSC